MTRLCRSRAAEVPDVRRAWIGFVLVAAAPRRASWRPGTSAAPAKRSCGTTELSSRGRLERLVPRGDRRVPGRDRLSSPPSGGTGRSRAPSSPRPGGHGRFVAKEIWISAARGRPGHGLAIVVVAGDRGRSGSRIEGRRSRIDSGVTGACASLVARVALPGMLGVGVGGAVRSESDAALVGCRPLDARRRGAARWVSSGLLDLDGVARLSARRGARRRSTGPTDDGLSRGPLGRGGVGVGSVASASSRCCALSPGHHVT